MMHECDGKTIFVEEKGISFYVPYFGWMENQSIRFCPYCKCSLQPERSKREDFKAIGLVLPDRYNNLPRDAVL